MDEITKSMLDQGLKAPPLGAPTPRNGGRLPARISDHIDDIIAALHERIDHLQKIKDSL